MSGIYIHIPFCKQACFYCNFHFSTQLKNIDDMVEAICKEIHLRHHYLQDKTLASIYFGGGTPSLLNNQQIGQIFEAIQQYFTIAKGAEITLEANPDDLTAEKLKELKQTPINRLSIGVQSFFDADLKWMNRAHNANQAETAIALAKEIGFHNITIDLIYGTPGLSNTNWLANVNTALALGVNHVSSYALTVEPKTALASFIEKGKYAQTNDEQAAEQFDILVKTLTENGFIHYEISNFGKAGFLAQHNGNYWKGKHYLGIGPSAHSFNTLSRSWNVANNQAYIQALQNNNFELTEEILSVNDQVNEYIMTGLRTIWGCDLGFIEQQFGVAHKERILKAATKFITQDLLTIQQGILLTTPKGKFLADGIAADLFLV
ncbi:MAG: radical SAM family heme chaperone HemW [Bacteroidota bacterium]